MKQLILGISLIMTFQAYSQNFVEQASFINYIEGDWEKIDTPNLYSFNSSKYLRFKFEKIAGDSLNLNVSAKSNTAQLLKNLNFNCVQKTVELDQDSTYYFAFLYLSPINPNLKFRIDSINQNLFTLKMKLDTWTDYSESFYFQRVNPSDTLITGFSCDSSVLSSSIVAFGCNDSLFTNENYSDLFMHERSTLDSSEVGVFIQNYPRQNSCDSLVILTVNLLDSTTLYLTNFLPGKWKWIYTHTGWGTSYADSLNHDFFWNVYQHDSMFLFPYTIYKEDTLYSCSNFHLLSDERVENLQWSYFLMDDWQYAVFVVDSNKVGLDELFVSDGPTYFFERISYSPIDYDYIITCNPAEIGIDTIYGTSCDTNIIRIIETYYDCPTSIAEKTEGAIVLHPNPSNQRVFFQSDEIIIHVEVFNFNAQKQEIRYTYPSNELNVSELATGWYYIKLFSNSKVYHSKFLKH
ncbi:MAG: T9SS type A sorting domain-containing protein [Chitinophagales bacterium]|nr:T9SS type A sorting domain-containing protein [Chitinophagales bacterium]